MRSMQRAWKQAVGRFTQQWDTTWVAGPVCNHCYHPINKRSQATRLFAYPDLVPDECTGDLRVLRAWIHRDCAQRERRTLREQAQIPEAWVPAAAAAGAV